MTSCYYSLPSTHHHGFFAGPLTLQAHSCPQGLCICHFLCWNALTSDSGMESFRFLFNRYLVLRRSLATYSKINIFSPFFLFLFPILLFSLSHMLDTYLFNLLIVLFFYLNVCPLRARMIVFLYCCFRND